MADKITFYTNPMSRGRIARWMLEEIGADYNTEIVEYGPPMKSADYLAMNPMGKVPALQHGKKIVTECAAICAYLADVFPEAGLAPPVDQRADYYRWLFFAAGPVEAAVTHKSFGFEPNAEQQTMAGYGTYALTLDTLERAVADGYIAGGKFSAADVYVGSHIGWGMEFGSIEKNPAFEKYWALVGDRDARRRAQDIDDALMPKESV